ncbi:MAG: hypothetical protein IKL28_04805 [Lachnospiraceae bacterium]|nr:hypothetical protein [Lachnospiraceae bacterium]
MKQHSSVFMLFVRSSFYKVLLLLLAMIAAEGVWFYKTIQGMLEKNQTEGNFPVMAPEVVFEEAHLMVFFAVAVVVLTMILSCVGRSSTGHQEYTWYRLSITPKSVFLWQMLYNCCCFLLLWFVQAALAFGLCLYYVKTADAGAVTHQSMFLAFYREPFLHGLIPLQHIGYWVRNVLLFCSLGFAVVYDIHRARQGKYGGWLRMILLVSGLSWFRVDLSMSGMNGGEVLLYAGIAIWMIFVLLRRGEWKPDDAGNK